MTTIPTFWATIFVGFRVGRTADPSARVHTMEDAIAIIRPFVDEAKDSPGLPGGCVTVRPTEYVYVAGSEPGIEIGFINYPRFPAEKELIRQRALELAERLRVGLEQYKVSVVFPDETVMLG